MIHALTLLIVTLLVSVHRHCQFAYSREQERDLPLPCTLSECSANCQDKKTWSTWQENQHRVTLLSRLDMSDFTDDCTSANQVLRAELTALPVPAFLCKPWVKSLYERRMHRNLWGTDSFPMPANKDRSVAFFFLPLPNDTLVCHNVVWKGVIPRSWKSKRLCFNRWLWQQCCHGEALWWCVHLDWLLTQGTIKRALHYNWWCFNWLPIYPLCVV